MPSDNCVSFPKSGKIIVYVDDREARSSVAEQLKNFGCEVKATRLPVADFIVSERAGVEKKLARDFEKSVVDGRLFKQAQEIADNFEKPLIIVVGHNFEVLRPKAVRGALIALMLDFKIPVLFAVDEEECAEIIHAIAEREQKRERRETPLRLAKKVFTLAQRQRLIIESLPMIGPKTAKKLLEHFRSVLRIFGASEEELQEVEGVGKVRAKEIRRVINSKYEKE